MDGWLSMRFADSRALSLEAHAYMRVLGQECRIRVGDELWEGDALRGLLILMFEM
jgi:hypothetical protein